MDHANLGILGANLGGFGIIFKTKELLATDPLGLLGLALPGKLNRWTEDKMFIKNEQLLGCKTTETLMKRGSTLQVRDALIHMPSG
jgi:hypothetical protein